MRGTKVKALALILAVFLEASLITSGPVVGTRGSLSNPNQNLSEEIIGAINVNLTNIESHAKYFASLGSRVTGYPGSYEAMDYIVREFRSQGLEVRIQNYTLAIPLDEGSYITVESPYQKKIEAYSLWPNGIQASPTPSDGISGRVIYAGDGSLSRFNGYEIPGAIVLMDFNSEENWVNAAKLGAKAVVFIAPDETDFLESLKKAVPVPINIPRLYVNQTDGLMLKDVASQNGTITVHNNMYWRSVTAQNVIAVVEGSQPDDVMVFSAHYDSWSIVPAIAPGAEDALGISSLLELSRYFSTHKPTRTLWFTAFSGYYQGLIGVKEWIEQNLYSPEVSIEQKTKIWLQIHLDFSTDSDALDALWQGPPIWYGGTTYGSLKMSAINNLARRYLSEADKAEAVNTNPLVYNRNWGTQQPFRDIAFYYYLPTQILAHTGLVGFTLRTQWAWRLKWWTPLTDEQHINMGNLKPQVEAAAAVLAGFANDPSWPPKGFQYTPPKRLEISLMTTLFEGYATLNATIVEYNITKGWYSPVSQALVRITLTDPNSPDPAPLATATALRENSYLLWPFNSMYRFAGEDGTVVFHGLRPWHTYALDAWKFDETDGSITYAPDLGIYGAGAGAAGGISNQIRVLAHPLSMSVPIFQGTEVTVFDLIDPRLMARNSYTHTFIPGLLRVYEIGTKSIPTFFGTYFAEAYGIGMVFVKKHSTIAIAFYPEYPRIGRPLILWTNSTKDNAEGHGYHIDGPLTITQAALKAAMDMNYMISARYTKLKDRYIRNAGAERLLEQSSIYLSMAEASSNRRIYDSGYAHALAALSLVSRAYNEGVMPLFDEASTFILFFVTILIFFGILFERLVFHSTGKRRFIELFAVLAVSLLILNFVNPTFQVITNSAMNIIGVGMAVLSGFIIITFYGEARKVMQIASEAKLGRHTVETGTPSTFVHLLGVATENLRRRRLLTTLTMVAIVSFSAAMTAFTSASNVLSVTETSYAGRPPYTGILLKRFRGWPADGGVFDIPVMNYLGGLVGSNYSISPRVWLYPTSVYNTVNHAFFVTPTGEKTRKTVFLGLSDEEAALFFGENIIGPGFIPGALYQCLLPDRIATYLNVTVGDTIRVRNYAWDLKVMGIIESMTMDKLVDFDAPRSLLPLDPRYSNPLAWITQQIPQQQVPEPVVFDSVIVVPWKTAYARGGFISSYAIIPKENVSRQDLLNLGSKIAFGMDTSVILGYGDVISGLSKVRGFSVKGWEVVWVLQAIAILSITNFLAGAVQQRRRDILVYSSVGMSPFGAVLMFLAEAMTYAVLASVIGYLIGYGLNALLITMVPTAVFNVSSLFIVVSLGAIILACIGSAIYPSIIASRIITPSLERKWKLRTKAVGDEWSITIPLKLTEEEATGLLAFLSEYYSGTGAIGTGYQVLGEPQLEIKDLALRTRVAVTPLELGIEMMVTFEALFKDVGEYTFGLLIERKSGEHGLWTTRTYPFIDSARKQALLWRSLTASERDKYIKMAKKAF